MAAMGPNAAPCEEPAAGVECRPGAPKQHAGVAARPSSHIAGGDDRRQALLTASLGGLQLEFEPAPGAAPSVWADPWATQTGLPLDVSAAWALPPPALAALPPRSASVPCTEDGGSKGAALGGLSLEEELARTRTMLALAQERNQLLEGLLEEHRLQGREQLEKIKALTRVNKDCRKEIATLQSQVWSQITTSLTRTPAPNAHAHGCGPVRYGGPAPPPPPLQHVAPQHQHQQQQQLYGAPYHRYARSGSGSPTEGEERDRRGVHVM